MESFDIARTFAALGPAPAARDTRPAGWGVRPVRIEGGRHGHAEAGGTAPVRSGRFGVEYRDGGAMESDAGQPRVVPRGREPRGVAPGGAGVILSRPA